MTGGVVVVEELALRDQGLVEIGRGRSGPERVGKALVLQVDHQNVVDRSRWKRCSHDDRALGFCRP